MGTQPNSRSDSARRVMDAIRHIVQALRVFDRAAQKQAGLSGAQLFVLQKLRDGRPQSLNDLARKTHTHQSSVSVVVQKLVNHRLVSRSRSPGDARQLELSITPIGRKRLSRAPGSAQDRLIDSLLKLAKRDCDQLAAILERLVGGIGVDGEVPALFFEERATMSRKKKRSSRAA